MKALIIRAEGTITNPPPGTPVLPDTTSGLFLDLDARTLSLSNGATVSEWTASGPASEDFRVLNDTVSGFYYPTYSATAGAGGTPALTFDGTQQIRTNIGDSGPRLALPFTVAVVCSGDSAAQLGETNHARYFSGTGLLPLAFMPANRSVRTTDLGLSTWGHFASIPTVPGHRVLVFSYNGASSAWGASGHEAKTISIAEHPLGGFGFGGSAASATPPVRGLVGTVTRALIFSRAFTTHDIDALVSELSAEYGI